jgi:hypothetical protein
MIALEMWCDSHVKPWMINNGEDHKFHQLFTVSQNEIGDSFKKVLNKARLTHMITKDKTHTLMPRFHD